MTYYGRWTYKFEEAQRQGAAGLLVLHNEAACFVWLEGLSGFSRADKYRSLLGDNECGSFGHEGMALGGGLQENVRP